MYNSYDVHFYASFALVMLWPKLQLSLQYDIADAILSEDTETMKFCADGRCGDRKVINTVPHDVGDPEDEPWKKINSYLSWPTNEWRDLNLKFVLQAFRDYILTGDRGFLEDMYPIMKMLTDASLRWDTDGDSMIENGSQTAFDQTYSRWNMIGVSAYCGGLWLAALKMMVESAKLLGKTRDHTRYMELLQPGKEAYETKLWNGKYYNFDCSTGGFHDRIMADQLAGNWYLKASGISDDSGHTCTHRAITLPEVVVDFTLEGGGETPDGGGIWYGVFPPENVKSSLKTVFENNVMGFANGNMGAINGTLSDGEKDTCCYQAEEFWVGTTYAVAAQMVQEDMLTEAFQTARGPYNTCWERFGLMFQSPEAYMTSNNFRSTSYMRPLAIWSMQLALEKYHSHMFNP